MITTHKYVSRNKWTIVTTLVRVLNEESFTTFMKLVEQYAKQGIDPINWLIAKDDEEMLIVFSDGTIVSIVGFGYRD